MTCTQTLSILLWHNFLWVYSKPFLLILADLPKFIWWVSLNYFFFLNIEPHFSKTLPEYLLVILSCWTYLISVDTFFPLKIGCIKKINKHFEQQMYSTWGKTVFFLVFGDDYTKGNMEHIFFTKMNKLSMFLICLKYLYWFDKTERDRKHWWTKYER